MFTKRRRLLSKAVQYSVGLLLMLWAIRTWLFMFSALTGSPPDGSNQGDAEDFDDDLKDIMIIDSGLDEEFQHEVDPLGAKRESGSSQLSSGGVFYVPLTASGFWVEGFRSHPLFAESISWSNPRVNWFVGGSCAVHTLDVNDRLTVSCTEQGLRLVYGDNVARYSALAAKVLKLARSRSKHCLTPDEFFLRPMRDIDRDIVGEWPKEETVIIRDKQVRNAGRLVSVVEAIAALSRSERVFVERFVPNPLLIDGKKFSIRNWVVPLRLRGPLLAYFGFGDVAVAKEEYSASSDSIEALVPSLKGKCIDDYMNQGLPPLDTLIPHMKRIALFALSAMADHDAGVSHTAGVAIEPFCMDFELDDNSQVWVVRISGAGECGGWPKSSESKCTYGARMMDAVDVMLNYIKGGDSFVAGKAYKSLELLVDEATFSTVADEVCFSAPSPYEQYIKYHRNMQEKIRRTVLKADGSPKTTYREVSSLPPLVCNQCGYRSDARASHCDVCGARLEPVTIPEEHESHANEQAARQRTHHRSRLIELLQKYDPARIGSIDVLLDRYKGEEDALILRLTRQYEALASSRK